MSLSSQRKRFSNQEIARYGILIALALIFSYLEFLIPLPVTVPGVKLGLANILVLFALIRYGYVPGFLLMLIKVVLSSILFGNPSIFLYSIAGGLLSYLVMALSIRSQKVSILLTSVFGAIFHNLGQLLVVWIIFNGLVVLANLPILLVSGVITGIITGKLCELTLKAVQ
ncbi:MAG: Gx transporter family protein [Coriobacteriia bacterium]|nr:Gx transporter family protein [Coriobacteriia bacterium]